MHPSFLPLLCCPKSGSDLSLSGEQLDTAGLIVSGTLKSADGTTYPIVAGVPRFVSTEDYSESFGYEWQRWSRVQFESENVGTRMTGHTTRMFDMVTGFTADKIAGKTVVEFGCGPGRFIDVVARRGGRAVGLELSSAADVARKNFAGNSNVCIVQGDILNPPFKSGAFDFGYTIGVLHHTPSPDTGLQKLVSTVKSGGTIACCVYESTGGRGLYDSPAVLAYRRFFNSLSSHWRHTLARWYAFFSAYVLYVFFAPAMRIPGLSVIAGWLSAQVFPGVYYLRDARWRVLDTFDAITPHYATTHTKEEVVDWFTKAHCSDIKQSPFGSTSLTAVK
ncbi:methyltransferase domain-containing protein [Patescibacteria group bacterium]|nr:methyltransferase domain-containing protein [Patescibacteria group bacterium]